MDDSTAAANCGATSREAKAILTVPLKRIRMFFVVVAYIFVGVPTGRGVGAKWDKAQERSGGWLDTYTDRSEQPAGEPEPEPCARVSLDQRDCCMCEGNN